MNDNDLEQMKKALEKSLKKNYKASWKVGDFFENILIFIIVCIAIIFRPINLIIIGIVMVILLLI